MDNFTQLLKDAIAQGDDLESEMRKAAAIAAKAPARIPAAVRVAARPNSRTAITSGAFAAIPPE